MGWFPIRFRSYGAGPDFPSRAIKIWLLRSSFLNNLIGRSAVAPASTNHRPPITNPSTRHENQRPLPPLSCLGAKRRQFSLYW
jgi:hypothetical protein